MNEEAQNALVEVLERALSGVDAAVEFSQQQVPDLVQQLLMWHVVEASVSVVIGIVLLAAIALVWVKFGRRRKVDPDKGWTDNCIPTLTCDRDGDVNEAKVVMACAVTVVLLIVSLANLSNIYTVLQIWLAPKLYLLEYGASLVK